MDRKAVLGKSKAELVMARVGEVIAAANLLFLLPILPILVAYVVIQEAVAALTGETGDPYEPKFGKQSA